MTDAWPAPTAPGPVSATVAVPGSKSATNRALVLAALADGPSTVSAALAARDTRLMAQALTSLGVDIREVGTDGVGNVDWQVTPGPLHGDVSIDVGLVTKNDVLMAGAAGAIIIGFHTKLENGVTPLAKHHGVRVEAFDIIYEMGDKVREMMADLLDPDIKEIKTGAAEVRQVFPLAKGFVAGCLVTEGKINRNALARLRRGKEIVHEGKIATLKRFKDDANEVRAGLECGIKLDDFNGYTASDMIECFEIQKVRAAL